MSEPTQQFFPRMTAATPSAAAAPVYTTSRLRQHVTAYFAQARAGKLTLDEAESLVLSAVDDLTERQAAAALLRDREVTADREGVVSADPPVTSARAARLVEPRTGSQRARLLEYVATAPNGVTDFEAARDLRLLPNSLRPRRNELISGGYIVDSGRTRQHRGSQWSVWLPTADGLAWHARQIGGAA